ncbi:hypothetical protein M3G18_03200 [Corynebacterium sp. p3-SID1145]|uniref:hypothetical protein n=1 Tax=unclassified Corynebacterium TaxID=2624378 RepID=UPI0021AA0EDE|nr:MULTISPECIES: hypothetical protein [unclassified Corynebacterium]MCT1451922.1 hypothetical protein [Corynebacterium sp. p3-SID1145]MCT1461103.1 hypothetical protein [Corynebacterium sp. p3-SID1140]
MHQNIETSNQGVHRHHRTQEVQRQPALRRLRTAEYPGFNNHADRYSPYVVTEYWCPEMEKFPGYTVLGPGPVVASFA